MKEEDLEVKRERGAVALDVEMSESKPAPESDEKQNGPPVEKLSMDIRGDLEQWLEGDLADSFKGSPSFTRTYSDAPNPTLKLRSNGIGRIGLPLNEREAKNVISGCIQASVGRRERTIIDTSICDRWEMDASLVVFENPAWHTYIQRVVQDVCTELGVDVTINRPRCEFRKLFLYQTGSHCLPHIDTEKTDGMFATLVVVLPSAFTGGAAHLSHGAHSAVYDTAAESLLGTTALAWYTDVTHEIKPITSGYRLALAYNLIDTTTALRPGLGGRNAGLESLRHVLRSWKQRQRDGGADVPQRIVYLLEHKYSQEGLRGSVLKKMDAHTLAALDVVAKELGFRLGLASLECHLSGTADVDHSCKEQRLYERQRQRGGRRGWGYDWEEEEEEEEEEEDDHDSDVMGFDEISETVVSITHLVDLHGNELQEKMEFDQESDSTIPETLVDDVQEEDYDEQKYVGYAGKLELWYRRTVLVIWPGGFNLNMTFEDDIQDAMTRLSDAEARPHQRERRLVDFLFELVKSRGARDDVAQALCDVACVWADHALWMRAVDACKTKGVCSLGNEVVLKSVDTFGFELVRPRLENMLNNEMSNHHRFQFLADIELWLGDKEGKIDDNILAWVAAQRQLVFNNLKEPVKEDGQMLLHTARQYGGLTLLRDLFVPQLMRLSGPGLLTEFATLMVTEQAKPNVSAQDQEILRAAVTDLLSSSIAKVDFNAATKAVESPSGYYYGPPKVTMEADPMNSMAYFKFCLATNNEPLVAHIVARLTNMTGVTPTDAQLLATKVLLPLLPLIHQDMKTRSPEAAPVPGIHDLHESAVKCYLDSMSGYVPVTTRDELKLLIQVDILYGGGSISSTIWPALKNKPYHERVLIDFIQELQRQIVQISTTTTRRLVESLIPEVLQLVIEKATYTAAGYGGTNHTKTLELLGLCADTGSMALCGLVFTRLLAQPFLQLEYVERILVPFIPELRAFMEVHDLAPHAEPFGAVFTNIVFLWAKLVLGPKPDDTAARGRLSKHGRSGCGCALCVRVFGFLWEGSETTMRLEKLLAKNRRHLESQLADASRACKWERSYVSAQGLVVTKHEDLVAPARWRAVHKRGQGILTGVSADNEELRKIFGADYQRVMDILEGRPPGQYVPRAVPYATTEARSSQAALFATPQPPSGSAGPSSSSATASTSTAHKRKQPDDFMDTQRPTRGFR